jgi:hypothetical protein
MIPKVDDEQKLPDSNGNFKITGPIGGWDSDEAAAVFTLVISQKVNGGVAIGVGKSGVYKPNGTGGPTKWSAPVEVVNGHQFQPGGATVFAWASIAETDGGWEMYPWGRPVELELP